ncbi:hypothetical protein H6F98_32135 [Microcoleus sp. FACHB-SPT15]|uniref:hypothetical protein n=1 Tax=Microcoleus sp. FACHB-SPT15 TaxID=2692830 RepID=UPI001782382C|nr:hypothetical protein [Microcoleus sp. FACHB-SPT15]MBD1810065.1 hypothetical protein [Microcoleus sp. FACHB-SPT15]
MNPTDLTKTRYEVTLTQEAWAGVETAAKKLNLSVSELFEQIGCGLLEIVKPEDIEDYLDWQDALEAEANPENQERIPWEQVKQELGL